MTEDLARVHGLLVEAVERQVERQWQQTQFFILLNASVLAGAFALLQLPTSVPLTLLTILVLAGGVGLAAAGLGVMRENKRYYRVLVAKKTLVEEALGLTKALPGREMVDLAVPAVGARAVQSKLTAILADPDGYAKGDIRSDSATGWARRALVGFIGLHVAAGVAVAARSLF